MKKLMVVAVLFFSLAPNGQADAQLRVNVNINIGNQPDWGPTGYDYVDYYYMPDLDVYYNVPQHLFIYPDGGRWRYARSLPPRYNGYNLYNSYKVVVNKPRPYLHADVYRREYGRYRGGSGPSQVVIRDSRDEKYKNHYKDDRHGDNGNRNNNGRGNNAHGDKGRGNGNGNENEKGHGNGKGHKDRG